MTQLRRGLYVVRRDDRHLQVGVDPPWRVIAPDEPDVRRLLGDLSAGRSPRPETPEAHRVLRDLVAADMVLDGGTSYSPRREPVAVIGTSALVTEALRLLRAEGCPTTTAGAGLALVLADGEARRDLVDEQVRASRPHLIVTGTARGWVVGPFVVPGRTACLRCVDAHRGERDPRRAMIVAQVGERPLAPVDPTLQAVVVGWAVREMLTYLDGARPATWSATVEVGADLRPRHHAWSRHPHCGCSWAGGAIIRSTG
jgi:hypothetical protein